MATRPSRRPPPEPGSAAPVRPADPVLVGRIAGAWGVHGWVRVVPFNDPRLSLLLRLPVWYLRAPVEEASRAAPAEETSRASREALLRAPRGAAAAGAEWRAVDVDSARAHGADEIVARFAGIDDRDAALGLEGVEIFLERERFPEPTADEVYWADLIGCAVLDPDGDPLGTVVAIEDHPAHPVMRLSDGSQQRLVPLVPELIRSVDVAARTVVADWRRDW